MDNRDDEQNTDKSASGDESHEPLAGQSDAFETPAEEAADDADTEIMEFGGTDRVRIDDAKEDDESESETAETEKDWLVESGLAAAINPSAPIPADNDESDEDELEDDDELSSSSSSPGSSSPPPGLFFLSLLSRFLLGSSSPFPPPLFPPPPSGGPPPLGG